MEQLEKYDEYLKEHLSQKRYTHSKNVSDASVMLAKKFGYPDEIGRASCRERV